MILTTVLLNKPSNDPKLTFRALPGFDPAISSPANAPTNGPISRPNAGITKGPRIRPIVLPITEAREPPNFLTPQAPTT
ncbi:hypothetical protein D3C86_1585320 [compost metagenome]